MSLSPRRAIVHQKLGVLQGLVRPELAHLLLRAEWRSLQ
jgi:hypothetical protein